MKRILKTAAAVLLLLLCVTMTALAVTPVIDIVSAKREKDGTVTVEISTGAEYSIVEVRYIEGDKDTSYYDSATVVHDNMVSGIKAGTYTMFAKNAEGKIGKYPLNVGEKSSSSESSSASRETWESSESYEYGGSWIEYQVQTGTCVTISKRDIVSGEELPGAKLIIKDASGNTVKEWTSTNTPHVIDMLKDGTYTLTEITAPKGYEVAETITFVIKDGKVSNGTESGNTIVMYDAPSDPGNITISKRDIVKGEELPGAKLIIKDGSGKTVKEWTSTNTPHVIDMLKDGTYTLTEITAPKGYEVAETITFVIKDGKVTSGAESGNHIVMYDAPIEHEPDRDFDEPDPPKKKETQPQKAEESTGVLVPETDGPKDPSAPSQLEVLPQTGGLDGRMKAVVGVIATFVIGVLLFAVGSKFSK